MAESTWSKNTTFHAFMLSLKRSNQFPHHILILQGRVPRCPGLASRDTALDSRGNIFQWTLCCRGRCLLSPLICKVPQLICLFRGRILPQTGSDIIYRMQAGIKNEVKIHDFTAWPPGRPRGLQLGQCQDSATWSVPSPSVQGAAAASHPSAASGYKEGFFPSHFCRLRPGAGEGTGDTEEAWLRLR